MQCSDVQRAAKTRRVDRGRGGRSVRSVPAEGRLRGARPGHRGRGRHGRAARSRADDAAVVHGGGHRANAGGRRADDASPAARRRRRRRRRQERRRGRAQTGNRARTLRQIFFTF